VYYTD